MPKVVIIDDEESVAKAIASCLRAEGFSCEIATTGVTGIELSYRTLPALIICDIRMPDLNGNEVTHILKSDPLTKGIPILMVSGQCNVAEQHSGNAFLQKPFALAELRRVARELIERGAGPARDSV